MTRHKTHLIAVKKFNTNKQEMIMRDVRDAMEYLATIIHHCNTDEARELPPLPPPTQQSSRTPATHVYCYDAKVIPFPQHNS